MLRTSKLRADADPHNLLKTFYLRQLPKIIGARISCLTVAKVTRYKKAQHECNVQPLPKQSDDNKRPIYNYCIVPASIYKQDAVNKAIYQSHKIPGVPKWQPLRRGSVVVIGAMDRELDNFNGKKPYKIETNRMHSYNDAVVLGVIKY